jgi:hypothetical protein
MAVQFEEKPDDEINIMPMLCSKVGISSVGLAYQHVPDR